MVIYSQPKSRPAESPYSRINAEAVALSGQAEVELLRRLLRRCDSFLAAVARRRLASTASRITMPRNCGGILRCRLAGR